MSMMDFLSTEVPKNSLLPPGIMDNKVIIQVGGGTTAVTEEIYINPKKGEEEDPEFSSEESDEHVVVKARIGRRGIYFQRYRETRRPFDQVRMTLIFILRFAMISFFASMILSFPNYAYVIALIMILFATLDTTCACIAFVGCKMRIGTYPYAQDSTVCTLLEWSYE